MLQVREEGVLVSRRLALRQQLGVRSAAHGPMPEWAAPEVPRQDGIYRRALRTCSSLPIVAHSSVPGAVSAPACPLSFQQSPACSLTLRACWHLAFPVSMWCAHRGCSMLLCSSCTMRPLHSGCEAADGPWDCPACRHVRGMRARGACSRGAAV